MKRRSIVIVVIVAAVAALGVFALSEYNRQNEDVATAQADVSLTAASLIREFEQDSAAAGRKYIDKIILVKGAVKSIDTSGVITLGSNDQMSSIQCMMDKRHAVPYHSIREGMDVSIKGKCNGFESQELLGTDVKMNFCVLENTNK